MRKNSVLLLALLTTLSTVGLASCKPQTSSITSTVTISAEDIVFKANGYDKGKPIYLERGNSVTVAATVVPSTVKDKKITWTTSNFDIEVQSKSDTTCLITAYDIGKATITATLGTLSRTLEIECVDKILPTEIKLESTNVLLPVSKIQKLNYEVLPENASNKKVSYTVLPLGKAVPDMVKIKEEDGEYNIVCEGAAEPGDKYEITIRSVADAKVKAVMTVEVSPLPVESMKFKNEDITISIYDPVYKMLPVFTPLETTQYFVDFVSLNPEICDIDEGGRLFPKKPGQATITATNKDNSAVKCETTVTVTSDPTEYVIRGIKKADVQAQEAKSYTYMDFENDKVAFQDWTKNKALTEDCNSSSHISDAGWAIWMVGQDTYDDDNYKDGAEANAIVYSKLKVPTNATLMQYVFRSHQTSNDYAKFRLRAIDADLNVHELSSGWKTFHRADDMFINVDVSAFAGQDVTFVVEQDQMGLKKVEDSDKVGVSLMFRRCLFNTPDNADKLVEELEYSIIHQNQEEGIQ